MLRQIIPLLTIMLCSSFDGPGDEPVNSACTGCVAKVTFDLPGSGNFFDVLDGGCWYGVDVNWTITRDLEIDGRCAIVEAGSCVQSKRCLASGRAHASVDGPNLIVLQTYSLSAGTNQCGGSDEDQVEIGDSVCSPAPGPNPPATYASITADCSACDTL